MTELRKRLGERTRGGSHTHKYRHALMHLGNSASVAIHPRDEQTHQASDSDGAGDGRNTPLSREGGREGGGSLAGSHPTETRLLLPITADLYPAQRETQLLPLTYHWRFLSR